MSTHANNDNECGGDWRASVAQSFRSEEIRSIAEVLASLEPGATSASKKMLAMKFEDSIFKAASGLDDYRATIQKKLRRLQKKYAKHKGGSAGVGGGGGGDGKAATSAENADLTREREMLFESELREKFGSRLLYIAKHADEAVVATSKKYDQHKADVLLQHAQNAKQWAVHLGLELPETPVSRKAFDRQERRDMDFLRKLKGYLETRVENIRSHIVKITNPDLFLEEALLKLDDVLLKGRVSEIFSRALERSDPDKPQFTEDQMKGLLERMNAQIPIPRRNREGDRVRAAVARIEKIRTAAQTLYIYMGLPKSNKTGYRGTMEKCHTVVMECLSELESEYNHLVREQDDKDEEGKRVIQLEDAWTNPLKYVNPEKEEDEAVDSKEGGGHLSDTTESAAGVGTQPMKEAMVPLTESLPPPSKRQRTEGGYRREKVPMVIRSRFLLTRRRKGFSTLLPALKRKRATMIRDGHTSYVRLEFGTAFEMIIYFVPLLVAIRAIRKGDAGEQSAIAMSPGGHQWPSLYKNLLSQGSLDDGDRSMPGKIPNLQVLGVTGACASVAPIIAKKLEYASAQATHVLRRCFAETAVDKAAMAKSEFEVEILETGALIKFLQIARSTYHPDWVDDDL